MLNHFSAVIDSLKEKYGKESLECQLYALEGAFRKHYKSSLFNDGNLDNVVDDIVRDPKILTKKLTEYCGGGSKARKDTVEKYFNISLIPQSVYEGYNRALQNYPNPAGGHVIVVEVRTQTSYHFTNGKLISTQPISTAKNGVGNIAHTNQTPLGTHIIDELIGEDANIGDVFRGRRNTGKHYSQTATDDDITTRILRLRGVEEGINAGKNREGKSVDSYSRAIYGHGASDQNLGTPQSSGCIRFGNEYIVRLFDILLPFYKKGNPQGKVVLEIIK